MMLKNTLFFVLFSCNVLWVFAQGDEGNVRFKSIDAYARSIRYDGNLQDLTNTLTAQYPDTISKVRAIFIWIADNIQYDYKKFNSGNNDHFECNGSSESCAQARAAWENDFLMQVLDDKKAVCSGYSKLFKKMCEIAGIQNEIVDGYVKKTPFQIGLTQPVSHSWNVVKLGGTYNYFDVTWAAGNCKMDEESGKLRDFVKNYEDFFWQTPKQKFMRNHFPKDAKWIAETNKTKEQFFNAPYFYPNELIRAMEHNNPDSGVIKTRIGDTIHFSFTFSKPIKNIQVNTNNYKNVDILLLNKAAWENNTYQFDYIVKESSLYYIEILFDFRPGIRYKVKF